MPSEAKREAGRRAGYKSGEAKRLKRAADAPTNGEPLVVSTPTDIDDAMRAYVEMVGKPLTWPDVKIFEQVKTEIFKNLDAARDLAVKARRLFTSEQVRARDERWNAIAHDRLDLVERLLDTIDAVPQDLRKAFLAAARSWRLETMRLLSGANLPAPPVVAPSASTAPPADSNNEQGNT